MQHVHQDCQEIVAGGECLLMAECRDILSRDGQGDAAVSATILLVIRTWVDSGGSSVQKVPEVFRCLSVFLRLCQTQFVKCEVKSGISFLFYLSTFIYLSNVGQEEERGGTIVNAMVDVHEEICRVFIGVDFQTI